jgi:hypothetical protein
MPCVEDKLGNALAQLDMPLVQLQELLVRMVILQIL